MSTYEWERGVVTIRKKDWPKFRRTILAKWNAHQKKLYEVARVCWDTLEHQTPRPNLALSTRYWDLRAHRNLCNADRYKIEMVLVYGEKLKAPRKKDFAQEPISRGGTLFPTTETSIYLSDRYHHVQWDVAYNNHSVEEAHEHPVVAAMFAQFSIEPSAKGEIRYQNEHNVDADQTSRAHYVYGL
jgi:hypothetical protein